MIQLDPALLRWIVNVCEMGEFIALFPETMRRMCANAQLPLPPGRIPLFGDRELYSQEELSLIVAMCRATGLNDSAHALQELFTPGRLSRPHIEAALPELKRRIRRELEKTPLMIVAQDRMEHWENPRWFGEDVYDEFPGARKDMAQAGNCYVADSGTASVFHSMRVAEHGLRVLAKRHLKVKKLGRIPIEFSEWGPIIEKIRSELGKLLEAAKGQSRGPKKDEQLKLYSDLIDQCAYFNDLWRKDVSHARRSYTEPEALNALMRVREFMQRLASPRRKRNSSGVV